MTIAPCEIFDCFILGGPKETVRRSSLQHTSAWSNPAALSSRQEHLTYIRLMMALPLTMVNNWRMSCTKCWTKRANIVMKEDGWPLTISGLTPSSSLMNSSGQVWGTCRKSGSTWFGMVSAQWILTLPVGCVAPLDSVTTEAMKFRGGFQSV